MTHEQLKQAIAYGAKTVKELKLWQDTKAYESFVTTYVKTYLSKFGN